MQLARSTLTTGLLWLVLAWGVGSAAAQNWPSGPIRLINPLAAGSAPDLVSRLIAEQLGRTLGQQVIVENRPGAANNLAAQAAARATPDGQTLLFGTSLALAVNPHTFKSLPYDPARDFVAISMIGRAPFFLVAHPAVKAKSVADLIALGRAERNQLTIATDGPKNSSGMLAAWLGKRAGIDLLGVSYPSMSQGVQDVVAGRVQLAVLAGPIARPLIETGTLRALAVSALERLPGYPDVPTIAEALPGFEFVGWFVLAAPAGTPVPIIARLNKELTEILRRPELAARFAEFGLYNQGADTPEGTLRFIEQQRALWGEIVRSIGISPE